MCNSRRRNAFTLIEVLIVVIIMAVLAATIIPQFTTSTKDAKESSLKFNMHTMRAQIELYKAQHNGTYPPIENNSIPKLTKKTTAGGADNGDLGPYVDQIPANPCDGKNFVTAVSLNGAIPTGPADGNGGWQYDAATGQIWPNCTTDEFNYPSLNPGT